MNSSNDLNAVELLDDVDNLLFLCDRLSNRLHQVTSYVDDVKQLWISKRRSIESDPNISPLIAQKASKCSKILLNVAEKLAVVELQTESLHALQSQTLNVPSYITEEREARLSLPSNNYVAPHPGSTSAQMTHVKNESINNGFASKRDLSSVAERSYVNQHIGVGFQTSLHTGTNSSINTFTPRNTTTLFSETATIKQSPEQFQSQQESAFYRPSSGEDNFTFNQEKFLSQNLPNSQTSHVQTAQKTMQNGLINGYQKQSSNAIIPRPSTLSDSYPSRTLNESNATNGGKVRVKMQVIKAGTIWHNADIPIIDHPSAFFACNQDPRVAEQFNIMAIEMNNHYNKPTNTTVPLHNPAIGDFCVARFSEDQHWYRARVVLIHGNDSILIVFIDYGNSETKPANEIYPMHEPLSRLPAMTVACTLAESFPRNEHFWSPETTEIFSQLIKNRIVEVHFQQGSGQQWPLHFVKVMLDGQSIAQHPKLASHITAARNEQIAMHFNDKLTSMEYILYNVAVVESDIYAGSNMCVVSYPLKRSIGNIWFYPNARFRPHLLPIIKQHVPTSVTRPPFNDQKSILKYILFRGDPREFLG
ncbi:unnamed protein product [Adineta steineri]|uniref:Tudor domain-containing protein n=1 Tax=Adineta steineri TaxID=433720 RepID=A0A815QC50_9BILA|nr:unnamed protein product [Adineta steineri]